MEFFSFLIELLYNIKHTLCTNISNNSMRVKYHIFELVPHALTRLKFPSSYALRHLTIQAIQVLAHLRLRIPPTCVLSNLSDIQVDDMHIYMPINLLYMVD